MNSLLPWMMRLATLCRIEDMERRGGPNDKDMREVNETADLLGEHGDVLLHGGGKPGQCAELFNKTAHAIAVLAFAPGGVEVFGMKFVATPKGKGRSS